MKQALLNKYGWIVNHKCSRRIRRNYHLSCVLPKPKLQPLIISNAFKINTV
uniref:hypothetical protein n=1 Tax=Turicibacter sp. KK003 TaxID=3114695 RepID=UPI00403FF9E9